MASICVDFPPCVDVVKMGRDYIAMRANMIYGKTHSFGILLERLSELKERFRLIKLPNGTFTDKAAIDPLTLAGLIEEAKGYAQKDNFLHDGATISIPVTRPAGTYCTASGFKSNARTESVTCANIFSGFHPALIAAFVFANPKYQGRTTMDRDLEISKLSITFFLTNANASFH